VDLWRQTLQSTWPVTVQGFRDVVEGGPWTGTVEIRAGSMAGACLGTTSGSVGQILLLLVRPDCQRQGLGRTLLAATIEELAEQGACCIEAGAGAGSYFWPGIPANLPPALSFWKSQGGLCYETTVDMILGLRQEHRVADRCPGELPLDASIGLAGREAWAEVRQFAAVHFPDWYPFYAAATTGGARNYPLVARQNGEVVGAALLEPNSCLWSPLFDGPVGSIGAVGVAEHARRQGIGLALSARGADLLQEWGMFYAYLGWTWLVDWYGQLGFEVWRTYERAHIKIGRRQ